MHVRTPAEIIGLEKQAGRAGARTRTKDTFVVLLLRPSQQRMDPHAWHDDAENYTTTDTNSSYT